MNVKWQCGNFQPLWIPSFEGVGVASANDFVGSDELDGAILFVMDCSHSTAISLATRAKEKKHIVRPIWCDFSDSAPNLF